MALFASETENFIGLLPTLLGLRIQELCRRLKNDRENKNRRHKQMKYGDDGGDDGIQRKKTRHWERIRLKGEMLKKGQKENIELNDLDYGFKKYIKIIWKKAPCYSWDPTPNESVL